MLCVCCSFVLERLRSGFVVLLRCEIYYCGVCKYVLSYVCEVGI